jgi:DNA-binding XRE family transcriptional regulator
MRCAPEATRGAVRATRLLLLAVLALWTCPVTAAAEEVRSTAGAPTTDNQIHGFFLMDQLESRFTRNGADALQFNGSGWLGGDYNRIWLKPEGTKLSQQELADAVGLSRASVVNVERGRHRVQIHLLYEIARVLGVEPQDL